MSRRDGKMYCADFVFRTAEAENGVSINFDHDGTAGYILVFWTKTAAREVYGRNVRLRTIVLSERDHE